MPSSLAAALAASKKSGPAATNISEKKKDKPNRPSSLMQYQKKDVAADSKPREKQGKQHTAKNHNKGNINDEKKPSKQKITPNKKSNHPDGKLGNKSPKRKGGNKGGKAPTSSVKNNDNAGDAVVFVCDIPSDSDDSDYHDECDGVDDDYFDGVDEDFEDGEIADGGGGDGVDQGGDHDSVDDLDLDVVVIMDGDRKNATQNVPRGKGGRHGKGARGGRGGRSDRDNRNDRGNQYAGRGRDNRGTPKHQHADRGPNKNSNVGRDFRHGNATGRDDRRPSPGTHANPALKPTPWSKHSHAQPTMKHDRDNHSKNQHGRNANPGHAGRHSNDRFPTRDTRHHNTPSSSSTSNHHHNTPSSSTSNPVPAFAPASTLINSNNNKKAAAPAPKLESAAIKGRWADVEDSSDDE